MYVLSEAERGIPASAGTTIGRENAPPLPGIGHDSVRKLGTGRGVRSE